MVSRRRVYLPGLANDHLSVSLHLYGGFGRVFGTSQSSVETDMSSNTRPSCSGGHSEDHGSFREVKPFLKLTSVRPRIRIAFPVNKYNKFYPNTNKYSRVSASYYYLVTSNGLYYKRKDPPNSKKNKSKIIQNGPPSIAKNKVIRESGRITLGDPG